MTPEELAKVVDALYERIWRRTRRWAFTAIVALGVLVPGILYATSITVPYTFTANTPARASEVNANFAALAAEATRVSNIVLSAADAGNRIVGLAPPIAAGDGANKAYIDAASSSGGAGALTLYGATSCPTGWTVALSGTMFIGKIGKNVPADTVGVAPPTEFACVGAAAKTVQMSGSKKTRLAEGFANNYGSGTPEYTQASDDIWVANADTAGAVGPCVICVK